MVNYRNAQRWQRLLERRLPLPGLRLAGTKAMALLDVAATLGNCLLLLHLIRREGVDLVHVNNGFMPMEAFWAARLARIPCVVHQRDFQSDPGPMRSPAVAHVARVLAVSDAVARSLEGTPIPAERVEVVHDPVDTARIAAAAGARDAVRRECGLGADEVVVGIFGRVVPWKGQAEFVQAAIRAMRRNARIYAVIVGDESDGSRDYLDGIRSAIAASGLAERFVLAGYRADVEAFYAAMDVVVHASISPEPFGMVVPEGMAAGRAVIAADAGGPREVITPGEDGLLVPPGDVEALAGAMVALADDPALRARMGASARRTAEERFGIEPNAARVRSIYAAVLGWSAGRGDAPEPARLAGVP
jgi:glycosyltransferase involved in cell wall biosynthesis